MTRRRRIRKQRATVALAALAAAAILAILATLAVTAQNGLPFRSYYYLNAHFTDAGNIEVYDEVRIAGRLVGQVLSTSYSGHTATVRLQLSPSTGPLRASTTARIRLKGLIGDKYIELTPGASGSRLPSGSVLPISHTSTTVDVFSLLTTFDAKRRADLDQVVGALGEGFLSNGTPLNGALHQLPALTREIDGIATAVNDRTGAAARFVPSSESLTAALDPVRQALAAGFAPEHEALAPFVEQRGSVQATLSEAPTALANIRNGLAATDPLLAQTAGFARAAVALTRPAPAALRSAAALLRSAATPLRSARTLLQAVPSAVSPTVSLAAGLDPLLAPTGRLLTNAAPIVGTLAGRICDVLQLASTWRSMLSFGTPPSSQLGPANVVRLAFVFNTGLIAGTPHPSDVYSVDNDPPPCAARTEHLP